MDELNGKRIFIVEDNISNMAVFATTLKKNGATVFQDPYNAESIELMKNHLPIDLILLDILLNFGVSGYDIFDQLQEIDALKTIPVVAVSSLDPDIEIPKAKAKGFAGFISKPISLLKFPSQLAAAINGEKVWVYGR